MACNSSHRLGQGKIIFSVCRYCFLSMLPSALDQVWVLTNVMTMTPLRGRLLPSIVMPPWRLITFIDYILWQHWIPDKNRKQNIKLALSACVCSGKNCRPRGISSKNGTFFKTLSTFNFLWNSFNLIYQNNFVVEWLVFYRELVFNGRPRSKE